MKSRTPVLDNFGLRLNGQLQLMNYTICHRKEEIDFVLNSLNNSAKRSVLLVGEDNVGKESILYGVLEDQSVKGGFVELEIHKLDVISLVAGTRYRGQFEERVKAIESELLKYPNVIAYVEDFKLLTNKDFRIYEEESGEVDISKSISMFDAYKPKIESGEIAIVTMISEKSYAEYTKEGFDFQNYFQILHVHELSKEESLDIIFSHKKRLEKHHFVQISDAICKECAEYGHLYYSDIRRPQNVINVLDALGAHVRTELDKVIPPELLELREKYKEIQSIKNEHVKNQQYEEAADVRDEESKIYRKIEAFEKELTRDKENNPFALTESDLHTMLSKSLFFDIDKIKNKEQRENTNDKSSEYFKEKFQDFDLNDKEGIIIDNIPEVLKTCLQQYIIYFREFLYKVKGEKIHFNVSIIENGLRLEIKPKEIGDEVKLQAWFDEYMEYIYEKEKEFSVNFEKQVSDNEARIAMAELKNQIRYFESQLEIHAIAISALKSDNQQALPRLQFPNKEQFLQSRSFLDISSYLTFLKGLVEKGKIHETLDLLKEYASHSGDLSISGDSVIVLKSNFSYLEKSKIHGDISSDDFIAQRQSITLRILNLINQIEGD